MDKKDLPIVVKALQASIETFSKRYDKSLLVSHRPTRGEVREDFCIDLFEEYFPKKYGVTSGHIFGNGKLSNQVDIIVFDALLSLQIPLSKRHLMVESDGVYGTVSVKTKLDKKALKDSIQNFKSIKKTMRDRGDNANPFKVIFSYNGSSDAWTIINYLKEYSEEKSYLSDIIYIHNKFLLLKFDDTTNKFINIIDAHNDKFDSYFCVGGSEYSLAYLITQLLLSLNELQFLSLGNREYYSAHDKLFEEVTMGECNFRGYINLSDVEEISQ